MMLPLCYHCRTKCLRRAQIIAIFSKFFIFEIKPEMRDVLAKCGNVAKMREFPHDYGTVDTVSMTNVDDVQTFMEMSETFYTNCTVYKRSIV